MQAPRGGRAGLGALGGGLGLEDLTQMQEPVMAEPISVDIPHKLGREGAREGIEEYLETKAFHMGL